MGNLTFYGFAANVEWEEVLMKRNIWSPVAIHKGGKTHLSGRIVT